MARPSARAMAIVIVPVVAAGLAGWGAGRRGPDPCERGWFQREVRIEHQRLESDPRPDQIPAVTPNVWPEDNGGKLDRRYLVARVCVRPLTPAERGSEPYTDGGPPIGAWK